MLGRRCRKEDNNSALDGYFQKSLRQERRIMMKIVANAIIASFGHEGLVLPRELLVIGS